MSRQRGELEQDVMYVLWRQSAPVAVRAVLVALGDPDIAYTTIKTVLERLTRKGVVTRVQVDRSWHYTAAGIPRLLRRRADARRAGPHRRPGRRAGPVRPHGQRHRRGDPACRPRPGRRWFLGRGRATVIYLGHHAATLLLGVLAVVALTRSSSSLRAPRTSILLWQAGTLTIALSVVGLLLAGGLQSYARGIVPGLAALAADLATPDARLPTVGQLFAVGPASSWSPHWPRSRPRARGSATADDPATGSCCASSPPTTSTAVSGCSSTRRSPPTTCQGGAGASSSAGARCTPSPPTS